MGRNKKTQINETVYGLNIYKDSKGRYIYDHPLLKEAYYIPAYDMKSFQIYRMRFILAIAAYIVLQTILTDMFQMNWIWPLVSGVLIFILIEFKFYSFVKKLQPVKKFVKEDCLSYFDVLAKQDANKIIAKIFAYILLGVLMVINSYQKNYTGFLLLFSWGIGIVCVAYGIIQILAFQKSKKQQPK